MMYLKVMCDKQERYVYLKDMESILVKEVEIKVIDEEKSGLLDRHYKMQKTGEGFLLIKYNGKVVKKKYSTMKKAQAAEKTLRALLQQLTDEKKDDNFKAIDLDALEA